MIPITVAKNGEGPTIFFLTGANHGDEYEGPVALCIDLASSNQSFDEAFRSGDHCTGNEHTQRLGWQADIT